MSDSGDQKYDIIDPDDPDDWPEAAKAEIAGLRERLAIAAIGKDDRDGSFHLFTDRRDYFKWSADNTPYIRGWIPETVTWHPATCSTTGNEDRKP